MAKRLAVLLRAVNVSGRNKVPMARWRDLLAELGCTDVQTHLQSGNAVVATTCSAAALAGVVHDRLRDELGVDTPVLVRTAAQLRAALAGYPWDDATDGGEKARRYYCFTDGRPSGTLDLERYAPDRGRVGPGVVWLDLPHGAGTTKVTATVLERQLGVPTTTRNEKTVRALLDLLG